MPATDIMYDSNLPKLNYIENNMFVLLKDLYIKDMGKLSPHDKDPEGCSCRFLFCMHTIESRDFLISV